MSFSILIQCPQHPAYKAQIRPADSCKWCALMFAVRNETNKVLSVPIEERGELREEIIRGVSDK